MASIQYIIHADYGGSRLLVCIFFENIRERPRRNLMTESRVTIGTVIQ